MNSRTLLRRPQVFKLTPSRCHAMNSRALLRRPRGAQAGTLTLPCHEQQNSAEKTNRFPSWHSLCHVMNSRALLRSPRGAQAGTLTLPCYEQQNTAEKTNRHKSVLPRCHVMNSRSLLRRPTGPQAGILRCHVMNSRALLRKLKRCPRLLVHSWCIPGALLVHSWCTPGALLVYSWCTSGALLVHSWCTPGALSVHFWCTLGALQRFPERELHRFRKEASILRTETFGSPFRQLANPKGNCPASERKPRSSAQKCLDRLFANLQTRKGIAPLPKGSLDPPHRKIWIILRQLANPKGNCNQSCVF